MFSTWQLVAFFLLHAGRSPKRATGCNGWFMDYIIAGVASIGLFIYLLYALLKPERF
jgi:K+-transporting ATPase KdpF subunit